MLIAFLAFLLALPAWSSQTAFVYVAIIEDEDTPPPLAALPDLA